MGVTNYGSASDPQNSPSLSAWAASVSAALDNSDTSVNSRLGTYTNGAWTSYTPSLTNITGTYTATGRYAIFGTKTIIFQALVTFGGAPSSMTNMAVSLPVTAIGDNPQPTLTIKFLDAGNAWYSGDGYLFGTTVVEPKIVGSSGQMSSISPTTPFTWGNGDQIHISGIYERA